MAFCSKCGTQLGDNETVCPSCGTASGKAPKTSNESKAPKTSKVTDVIKSKMSPQNIGIIAVAVVAIIVIVLFAKLLSGGPKKPIKTAVKVMKSESCDLEDYLEPMDKLYSGLIEDAFDLVDDIDGDVKDELDDVISEMLEDVYKDLEKTYGKDIKITYDITDKEKVDKETLKEVEKNYKELAESIDKNGLSDADELWEQVDALVKSSGMEELLGDYITKKNIKKVAKFFKGVEKDFEDANVSKGYFFTMDVTIKGDDKKEEIKDIQLAVLKVNGKWGMDSSSYMRILDEIIGC